MWPAAWRASQLRIRLEERANAILGNLALTGNLEDQGLNLSTEDQIRRQDFIPDAAPTLSRTLFVSLAMIESTAIYCFVVAMILLFANPFWEAAIEVSNQAARG